MIETTPAMMRARTAGRTALLVVLRTTTQAVVARHSGVTQASVSMWCSGRSRPGGRARRVLSDLYGIRPESWGPLPSQWLTRS